MIVSQIFAKAENDVIGNDNALPWHLPEDLKFFKRKTSGHPVIMGRKTFESLGKPLPGRTNIVITTNKDFKADGCIVVQQISEAIEAAKRTGNEEVFIIGGAKLFSETLEITDRIYLTEVKAAVDGNVKYKFDKTGWKEVFREAHVKDEKHLYDFTFLELVRP